MSPAAAGEPGHQADRRRSADKPAIWEWVAAALGAAVVLAAIGFMIYEAMTGGPHPIARITVEVDTIVPYSSGYVVEFRAINEGDASAARVVVSGELRSDTGVVERAEVTVDYVPARSWRKGGFVFAKDPRAHRVELRSKGFDRP
jgi:uncharacterized protein (TIGR02588 family)